MSNFLHIVSLLGKKRKYQIFFLVLLSVIVSFLELLSIGAILPFIDLIINGDEAKTVQTLPIELKLLHLSIGLGIVCILAAFMKVLLLIAQNVISHGIGSDISFLLINKVFSVGYETLIEKQEVELTTTIWQRTNEVVYQTVLPCIVLVSSLIVLLINFAVFIFIEPVFTMTILGALSLVYTVIYLRVRSHINKYGKIISDVNATLLNSLNELFGRYRNIVLNDHIREFIEYYISHDKQVRRARARVQIVGGFPKIGVEAAFILIVAVSGILSVRNTINMADYLPLFAAFAFGLQKMLPHVQNIYQSKVALRSSSFAFSEIKEFLSNKDYIEQEVELPSEDNVLWKFEHVSYTYPEDNSIGIDAISFEIHEHETVCISGPSGAGKTTLLDLLLQFRTPTSGKVHSAVRGPDGRSCSIITQNYDLIDATIRDNICRYSKSTISDQKIWEILRITELDGFIKSLPGCLDYKVINDASNFSGGQRQRLNLAAGLIEDADILLLDEPTSNLDADLEYKIFNNILVHNVDKTIVFVTHSEKLKLLADKIIDV